MEATRLLAVGYEALLQFRFWEVLNRGQSVSRSNARRAPRNKGHYLTNLQLVQTANDPFENDRTLH
jgi:hypothetical protein